MQDAWTSGEAYDELMGRWSNLLAPRFVEWARIPRGGSILDVGCGTGSLSRALVVGGASRVTGVDVSPGFVSYATATVGREHANAAFEVGDAMKLGFPDGAFDAAVSCLLLNFVPDPTVTAREIARVVRDGGLVGSCVWDYAGGMEMLRRFWDAAVTLGLPGAKELDEGVRFPICKPDRLAELFRRIGSHVETAALDIPMVFRDFEDYWRPFLTGIGPSGGFAVKLDEVQGARMRDFLEARMPRASDGTIRLVSRAWAVRAVRD